MEEVNPSSCDTPAVAELESIPPPAPKLRQRKSGRVTFSEENLAMLRADSIKDKAMKAKQEEGLSWGVAFFALALARYFSSKSNIVHDCDEVFNYWEPLHFLVYKSGFQTWEYSSEFALRSYLYLLFHALFVKPASWLYDSQVGKVQAFYFLRFILGLMSASTEASLVAATSSLFGRRLAAYTLMLLCFTSGCFTASTSFLPSTFSMYTLTLSSAALLYRKPGTAVAVGAFGVLVGWPFSVLAFVPVVLYALATGGFLKVFMAGLSTSVFTVVISAVVDRQFYGKWTSSVLNLVIYNVLGGGDSSLYGVEGPLFYLRNAFNNFNIALILALVFLVLAVIKSDKYGPLLIVVSPVYLWLSFMSLQPHKEERFLYPIYPLICLAAAALIETIPELLPKPRYYPPNEEPPIVLVGKVLRPVTLAVILVLSYSRTTSLLYGYSAPMQVYRQLPTMEQPKVGNQAVSLVCVGAEWHRFPSSFFLPSASYELGWLDDGFRGLLPLPFNSTMGGTASAPTYFNKLNKASPLQFVKNEEACSFLVELRLERPDRKYRGDDSSKWEEIWKAPFLDAELSPALHRAFFIPWSWESKNNFGSYRLLKRKEKSADDSLHIDH
ncbi:alpha-1,2-mannosyltransferase [Marchantia polymorpha subsp. ruderalis]|uniref:Mannosyltransferase n=2 Tax=Marchantia polymorpha TaxID=3197 RepID=A0AAF6BRC1_MARPO|nr:hypothetical protein MARPO_0059s0091 [Marchantia polymorpha]BBN14555.1 hypothetical protein Mp_6g12560 [Marchantia polymorpha subsp. ruderalis]|eukprot:PTQ37165.1 hypothetical protein MARPO_0059s0091 [Marchantia polymorpha]